VDLSWFKQIVPCGLADKNTTSLSDQLKRRITVSQVIPQFVDSFGVTFGREMVGARESQEGQKLLQEIEVLLSGNIIQYDI
jgi:lipoyl(octanoyl) transferase